MRPVACTRFSGVLLLLCLLISACDPAQSPTTAGQDDDNQTSSTTQSPQLDIARLKQEYAQTPFRVLRINEQRWQNAPALAVTFSVPLEPTQNLDSFLSVDDEHQQRVAGAWVLDRQATTAYFPTVIPEQRYQVNVQQGLAAVTGRLLESAQADKVRIRSLPPSVRFTSRGSQLAPALTDGLAIETVNVDAVDIDLWRVKDSALQNVVSRELGNRYYDLQRLREQADLLHSARFDIKGTDNTREERVLPLQGLPPFRQPGIWVAVMKAAGDYPHQYATTWFSVSDLGLQVRDYSNQRVALVHHVMDAKPRGEVDIALLDAQGSVIRRETTDAQGVALFPGRDTNAVIALARSGEQVALVALRRPALDFSEFALPKRLQHALELFIYSPRDLYRPGETATINALLRDHDGQPVQAQPVNVEIRRPDGRVYQTFVWHADEQGFFTHDVVLPAQALTGRWWVRATLGNDTLFEYPLQVEDFLPERMRLTVTPEASAVAGLDTQITLSVQGDYLWGAPAAGNRLETTVRATSAQRLTGAFEDFEIGDARERLNETQTLPAISLNLQGQGELALPDHWRNAKHPVQLDVSLSLFESGGRPVTRQWQTQLWPQPSLVAVRPLWQGGFAKPEQTVELELIHIDQAEQLLAQPHLEVTLVRVDSRYYWQWADDGWSHQDSVREQPVYQRVVSWQAGERFTLSVPVEYGNYRLELRDKAQRLITAYPFFAGWTWDAARGGRGVRPEQVTLKWDQEAYSSGDQARLTLQAPFDGLAFVTVEANQLLWHGEVSVKNGSAEITIPVAPTWQRHDLYATALLLRPGERGQTLADQRLPRRAWGMRHLPLQRSERRLDIALSAPERVRPDQRVEVGVTVANAQPGQPVAVTLAAVDEGVLSLTRFITPDPFQGFFAPRAYTGEVRDTYGQLQDISQAALARLRFGGDGEPLARGGDAPVSDVHIVSLFSGKVLLDAQGQATIPLDIPYFNGELRLMALAFDQQRFGATERPLTIAAPVVAEVSMPRFLAFGDQTEAVWDVQNLLDEAVELQVTVAADVPLGGASEATTISLSAKGEADSRTTLRLPLSATQAEGAGTVRLLLKSTSPLTEPVDITREWRLGLRPPFPAQRREQHHVVAPGQQIDLQDPLITSVLPGSLGVQLNVSATPPLDAQEHLSELLAYPYGCLEQTSSRLWPYVLASEQDWQRFHASRNTVDIPARASVVAQGIGRVAGMQRFDGGFGLWRNSDPETPWVSVYATELLMTLRDAGYSVDVGLVDRAVKRLQTYLGAQGRLPAENALYSEQRDHYHLAYRAYAAMVLSRLQLARLADVRQLLDQYQDKALSPLPLAQLAVALENLGDTQRAALMWQKALAFTAMERFYAGDYSSPVRDLAWTLRLALDSKLLAQPAHQAQPLALLFPLRDALKERRWLSTQERMALYRLAQRLATHEGETWQADLQRGGDTIALQSSQALTERWHRGSWLSAADGKSRLHNTSRVPLYVTLTAQGYPKQAPQPVQEGITLQRDFFDLQGKPRATHGLQSGDWVLVRVILQSLNRQQLPDVLLTELLPAGLELDNQNLAHATRFDDVVVEGKTVAEWQQHTAIIHQEYRDDRFAAAINLNAYQPAVVFYLARAVTPGEYVQPPGQAEDMYRPFLRAISNTPEPWRIEGHAP